MSFTKFGMISLMFQKKKLHFAHALWQFENAVLHNCLPMLHMFCILQLTFKHIPLSFVSVSKYRDEF